MNISMQIFFYRIDVKKIKQNLNLFTVVKTELLLNISDLFNEFLYNFQNLPRKLLRNSTNKKLLII
jgi:hypothetical protein